MITKTTVLLITLTVCLTTFAGEKTPPTLKVIMQGLEKSMGMLNKGIFYDDFNMIEKSALAIAFHPKPKQQLPIVVKALGKKIGEFKLYDIKVHDAANEIAKLAKQKNFNGILEKHQVIINNCIACHQQFKSEISKVLSIK